MPRSRFVFWQALPLLGLLAACDVGPPPDQPLSLLDAAEQGDLQSMDDFLQGRQLLNMRDACRWKPLMKAALNGHYPAVKKLLDKGAEVDLVDKGGYTAMMLAASNNFADVVELLLENGAEVDHVEQTHGWSALIWSAKRGHVETVEVLLQHEADRSIRDDKQMSALQYAEQNGFDGIVRLLTAS
ncbi:MAG: ankyrin repeat domain-containing protein [Gammaproteobacteria bacterium]|nr:ankyrin repeat domain-containing protein [Gammaproteobacteria bacterium]